MKKFPVVFVCLLLSVACKKQEPVTSETMVTAKIKGGDIRACACCGGWLMDIGTTPVRTLYNVDSVDANNDSIVLISYIQPASVCGGVNELVEIQAAKDN